MSDTRQKDVIGCPRCKTATEEVARIKPLQKVQGLIAYVCPSSGYTTSEYCRRAGAGVRNNMALKLRPTGLGSGIHRDGQDFTIYSGDWAVGRILDQRGGPDSVRWFWSLHGILGKPADMRADGQRQRSTG